MKEQLFEEFTKITDHSLEISSRGVKVVDQEKFQSVVHRLAEISAFEAGERQAMARYLVRAAAADLGIYPASIHELYMARGRGDVPNTFTVPAMNLRVMAFDCARAVFKAANDINGAAIIFEIARSEMTYSDQRPAEYTTSILAAAIAEGYHGPVFIQGDHFQVSAKRYKADPVAEIESLKTLIQEALTAGFFNIDVDTSTLVDIDKPTVEEQQVLNVELSAMLTAYIRDQQPGSIEISIGGEIGEVGGHNSTVEELKAYLDGFNKELKRINPKAKGLSKISIQTGTSHGGVVLPDGSIATVNVDFDTLR
ncbi:MAG TPA: class II fructose-bisphosphate aldolase, partial [Anaerolineaceae bacterium]|nr:class II fructose-bisphosphate aldolase [Anaerolineaceae bacterium]